METKEDVESRSYNILVYGIERKGLVAPVGEISNRNFKLIFEPFNTASRFNDFDGVFLFQGIFEEFVSIKRPRFRTKDILKHHCDINELDKRKKELYLLLKNEGFVCFILCDPFLDHNDGKDYTNTDLTKHFLNYEDFRRKSSSKRFTYINCKRSEFSKFFEIYGAACTYFENFDDNIDLRIIAEADRYLVGMIMWNCQFFIPSMLPDNTQERIGEYFSLLADAVTSTYNKLLYSIPEWVNEFQFSEESKALDRKKELIVDIENISLQLEQFQRYKRILLFDSDTLVEPVVEVLRQGFGLKVDEYDEYREDIKILDDDDTPIIFGEIKGTNAGIKYEPINQVHTHRERAGLAPEFPAILIINTHIKNSRTVIEKDKDPNTDQIVHAVRTKVLILRTLDLLRLLKLLMDKKVSKEDVLKIFQENNGWLKVTDQDWEVVQS